MNYRSISNTAGRQEFADALNINRRLTFTSTIAKAGRKPNQLDIQRGAISLVTPEKLVVGDETIDTARSVKLVTSHPLTVENIDSVVSDLNELVRVFTIAKESGYLVGFPINALETFASE